MLKSSLHICSYNNQQLEAIAMKNKTNFLPLLAASLATTSAFITSPATSSHGRCSSSSSTSHTLQAQSFENEIGAQPPLGFFDPLGLLEDADQERFNRLRYVETKHGRISMLAVLGHVVTSAGIRLPGNIDIEGTPFESIPTGIGALTKIPAAGFVQILAFVGFLELAVMRDISGEAEFPGDFRNGYIDFGWDDFDEETKMQKRAIELNNGRAAMMGILALMVHEKLDNNPYIVNDLLGFPVDFNSGL